MQGGRRGLTAGGELVLTVVVVGDAVIARRAGGLSVGREAAGGALGGARASAEDGVGRWACE